MILKLVRSVPIYRKVAALPNADGDGMGEGLHCDDDVSNSLYTFQGLGKRMRRIFEDEVQIELLLILRICSRAGIANSCKHSGFAIP